MAETATAKKTEADVKKVTAKIIGIYARREASAFALAQSFAIRSLNTFRKNQSNGKYWQNRTQQAFQRVFSNAFKDATGLGFYLAHGVDYGIYLELANNRKNAALKPITSGIAIAFVRSLKKLYGKG